MSDRLPVAWFTLHPEQPARGFWDQHTLIQQLERLGSVQRDGLYAPESGSDGAVVVLPGRMNYGQETAVREALAPLDWVVLVVTSDEEGGFDWTAVDHPAIHRHIQTPTRPLAGARFAPLGSTPHMASPRGIPRGDRPYDWAFLGQITHERRELARAMARGLDLPGLLATTDRFGGGLPADVYAEALTLAKVILCPAGPVHPETFRMYEALEAGCVPISDRRTPAADWSWWWDENLADRPFPLVDHWTEPLVLDHWQHRANVAGAWWKRQKLAHGDRLLADAEELAGRPFARPEAHLITAVVTVSPIPSNPETHIVQETVDSVLERIGCRVVLACDGVRPEQEDRRADYELAVARLVQLAQHHPGWENVSVVVADEWGHQANLTRRALDEVATPTILFVEQDTPLVGEVPWTYLALLILDGDANTIRLHHETHVLPDHRHLMLGSGPTTIRSVPAWQTRQWSQRPHLSSTAWYREMLAEVFPTSSRTMIEDYLHGVVQDRPWEWSKLWLYAPDGNMKRSTHLDGREGAPKFDMRLS